MRRFGLLVSCEMYNEYENIEHCYADSILLEDMLETYCDYKRGDIEILLVYPGINIMPDNIYQKLKDIVKKSSEEDTVLFYFAGHGMRRDKKGFLILSDTNDNDLENTALNLSTINRILSEGNCPAFIILDACHSGIYSSSSINSLYTVDKEKSCTTLASCSDSENSYPYTDKEQGAFTFFLAESIGNMPLESEIYIETLKIAVCKLMKDWCSINEVKQTPTLLGTSIGNVSIAIRNSKKYEYLPSVIKEGGTPMTTDLIENSKNDYSLWQSNTGVLLPKIADIRVVLSYDNQLRQMEQESILLTYSNGYFETSAQDVWSRALHVLRTRILAFGPEFVGEMVGLDNMAYVQNLPDFETINLAMELGFIDGTGKVRLLSANEILQQHLRRDVSDEMSQAECDVIIRACIQYILGYEDSDIHVEFVNYRSSLTKDIFDDAKIAAIKGSPYFYKKTTIRTLVNLLSSTKSVEFDTVKANFQSIVKGIWDTLNSDDRYFIGLSFSKCKNAGDQEQINAYGNALLEVKGFDYVPENLRSLTFIGMAKQIKKVHYGMNNFYNEPSQVQVLERMGTKIPRPAIKECIGAVLMVLLGNAYGNSYSAVTPSKNILKKLSNEDWKYYVEQCMIYDDEVLGKIACGDGRTNRWCDIANEFHLQDIKFDNTQVHEFIESSVHKNYQKTKSWASYFMKSLQS